MRFRLPMFAIAAALMPAAAHAEEWWAFREAGDPPDRTISFGDLAGQFKYGDGIMGWRVTAYEHAGADGVTYRREQWHFFCTIRTMALYYWETSDASGRRIAEQRLQDADIRYVAVVPGTTDDAFRQLYCDDPEAAGAEPIAGNYRTWRDRQFEAGG